MKSKNSGGVISLSTVSYVDILMVLFLYKIIIIFIMAFMYNF